MGHFSLECMTGPDLAGGMPVAILIGGHWWETDKSFKIKLEYLAVYGCTSMGVPVVLSW